MRKGSQMTTAEILRAALANLDGGKAWTKGEMARDVGRRMAAPTGPDAVSGLRERLEVYAETVGGIAVLDHVGWARAADRAPADKQLAEILAEFDPSWTAVENELPEVGVEVDLYLSAYTVGELDCPGRVQRGEWAEGDVWWCDDAFLPADRVTHWKPVRIPAPPEGA